MTGLRDPLMWRILRAWLADVADHVSLAVARPVDRLRLRLAKLAARLRR